MILLKNVTFQKSIEIGARSTNFRDFDFGLKSRNTHISKPINFIAKCHSFKVVQIPKIYQSMQQWRQF